MILGMILVGTTCFLLGMAIGSARTDHQYRYQMAFMKAERERTKRLAPPPPPTDPNMAKSADFPMPPVLW